MDIGWDSDVMGIGCMIHSSSFIPKDDIRNLEKSSSLLYTKVIWIYSWFCFLPARASVSSWAEAVVIFSHAKTSTLNVFCGGIFTSKI